MSVQETPTADAAMPEATPETRGTLEDAVLAVVQAHAPLTANRVHRRCAASVLPSEQHSTTSAQPGSSSVAPRATGGP